MPQATADSSRPIDTEPRWPAIIAITTSGLAYMGLPASLAVGPRWLLIAIVAALEIPAIISHRRGHTHLNRVLGYLVSGFITLFMIWSLFLLIKALIHHGETPLQLLISACILWFTNVMAFALWYWRLDAGGPSGRAQNKAHTDGDFLFPQMSCPGIADENWRPLFIDYLFLAFNTSTAFSPTDVAILGRSAKILVMIQSLISLAIVVILAARAVNIL